MKLIKNLVVIIAIGIIVFLGACKEEEEPEINRVEILTAVNWNITSMTGTASASLISEDFNGLEEMAECNRDDLFAFDEDNTYDILDNTNQCNTTPSSGIISSGSWSFQNNSRELELDTDYINQIMESLDIPNLTITDLGDGGKLNFEIESFSEQLIELFLADNFQYIHPQFGAITVNLELNMSLEPVN